MSDIDHAAIRATIKPALGHLIRLEAYFRVNGLEELSEGLEAVLGRAEALLLALPDELTGPQPAIADGTDDARQPDDQDPRQHSAASTPAKRGRAALG